ncbi:MAG: radical SAM protein [Candidatus Micrarchaeota archaeon]
MKSILFINPPATRRGEVIIRDLDRSGRKSMENTIWPQTSLAYLAAVMKPTHDVDVIDCIGLDMYWPEFEKELEERKPDYVLFNVISSTLGNDMRVAESAKRNGGVTIAVGPHVTAIPEETLEGFTHVDYILIGEAEETLRELIDTIEDGKDPRKVKGIAFRRDGNIVVTPERPLTDLEELPIPLHELLPIHRYNLPFIGKRYTFIVASRGCPYRCTFCRSPVTWKWKVRVRSAESIIRELRYLKGIGVRNFMFHTDVFTIDREVLITLCKKMVEEKLGMRWVCNSRVDTVNEEKLSWMKKAGCWMIAYGIESGSQAVLDNVSKGINREQIETAVTLTKRAGIKIWGYFIIGLPGENSQTVNETIELSKRLDLDLVNFAIGTPYPGTLFYKEAKEKGWLVAERWEQYDQNYSPAVSYPEFSDKDILKAIKRAYLAWYLRPKAVLKIIGGIGSFHDAYVLFRVAVNHIMFIKR